MKRKNIIAVCCLLLIAASANAQKETGSFSFIPRIGLTLSNLTDMDIYVGNSYVDGYEEISKSKMKAGITAGVDVEYQLLPALGVSLGMHYAQQGCRHSSVKDFKGVSTHLHYLNFPLMGNIYVGNGFALRAGVQLGVKVSDKESFVKNNSAFKTIDVSIPLGVSYEWKRFIVGAHYNFGLTNVPKLSEWKSKNQVLVIDFGYRI